MCLRVAATISDKESAGDYEGKYTFFNINRREFVQVPEDIYITKVCPIREGVYALYDKDMNHRYFLVLPCSGTSPHMDDLMLIDCMEMEIDSTASDYGLPSDLKEAEKKIVEIYENTGSCGYELMSLVKFNPAMLSYSFPKANASTNISFSTSKDGKVRLYSWEVN